MPTENIDARINELVADLEKFAAKETKSGKPQFPIVEFLNNANAKMVFTHLDIFKYLDDTGWVAPEEKGDPKQFYLCSLSNDHNCGCVRDIESFKNKKFKKAFDEAGNAFFTKEEILKALETVVSFLNDVRIDMYAKGYIK
jgi:hypothetical protein